MKKTDKKIENSIRESLTGVCEIAVNEFVGFKWITHFVDYNHFPQSLCVVCVFDTNESLASILSSSRGAYLSQLIKNELSTAGVQINDTLRHVSFDTEEMCEKENGGKWNKRFNQTIRLSAHQRSSNCRFLVH